MCFSVTVITVTRRRPELLKRAILSVQQQDYSERINHLVIVDDCSITLALLKSSVDLPNNLFWYWKKRQAGEKSGTPRLAKLLNYAVQLSETEWISFLDDDNEFQVNHISSLVDCARYRGCPAVHSHMQIYDRDGTPYLKKQHPWTQDKRMSRQVYEEWCAKGILQPGSNIAKDRADPWGHPYPARTVDKGEWLIKRSLLLEYPFCTEYTEEDIKKNITDDDKLLKNLVENGVSIACTQLPTLKYYLGGYSNSFE